MIKEAYYNKGAKELTRLHQSAVVRIRDRNWVTKAVVLEEVAPRSYKVMAEGGAIYRRNIQDQLQVRETFESEPPQMVCDQRGEVERGIDPMSEEREMVEC